MKKYFPDWVSISLILAAVVASGPVAQATSFGDKGSLDSISLGFDVPTPMGNAYDTLSRAVGLDASIEYSLPGWDPSNHLVASVFYDSFGVNGLNNLNISSNVNLFGFFGAFKTAGSGALWGTSPFLSLGIGGVYDWMTFNPSNAGTASNTAIGFATEVTPGLDVPVWGNLSAELSFPWMSAFFKGNTLVVWSGDFSLRWKL